MSDTSRLRRQPLQLRPDPARVLVRPFKPAIEPRERNQTDEDASHRIIDRVAALGADGAQEILAETLDRFCGRHRNLLTTLELRAREMETALDYHSDFTEVQRQLVGAYFLNEYAFEAAALFNPSIIAHPDQTGAPEGGLRFILSLRAVGEGHISSLTFRTGRLFANGDVSIDPGALLASTPEFITRLWGKGGDVIEVAFNAKHDVSERVIFPITESQSNGIEDARFVQFQDGADTRYYATYTAYNGRAIRSELIETSDFVSFRMTPLRGSASRGKGMALFPRKLGGKYAMIGRQDNENLYLNYSDDLYSWHGGDMIMSPVFPWEFLRLGNCGSPIELDEGWLLLTHGVGPLRQYAMGAALLDKSEPSRVIARSSAPLIRPEQSEREGYVPNVVYSCGALRHGDLIVLPYALSDTVTVLATVTIREILAHLGLRV